MIESTELLRNDGYKFSYSDERADEFRIVHSGSYAAVRWRIDGQIVTLRFEKVRALRWTAESLLTSDLLIDGPSLVHEVLDSSWRHDTLSQSRPNVELNLSAQHYLAYFRDRGSLEVLCHEVVGSLSTIPRTEQCSESRGEFDWFPPHNTP
jgi:hypothetical protein